MGSILRWLAGLAGLAGVARLLRAAREPAALPPAAPAVQGVAAELAGAPRPADVPMPRAGDEGVLCEDDPVPEDGEDPAEELRRRLAAVRAGEAVEPAPAPVADLPAPREIPTAAEAALPVADDADAEPGASLDERRARIHARAQEAIEAMKALDG